MEKIEKREGKETEHKAKILVLGEFDRSDIVTEMIDREMPKNPELTEKIEEAWAPKAARGWFPGPLVRVEKFQLTPEGKLELTFGKTNFKEYTGSRDLESLRKYGVENIANPLSISSVLITADNKMMIAQKVQGDAAGSIDAIGGYVNPKEDLDLENEKIDIFKTAIREITEETAVQPEEIKELRCLGLSYEYAGLCHFVISFAMRTDLSSEEVKKRMGEDKEINVLAVDPEKIPDSDNQNYVMNLLLERYPNVEPDGRVTIALSRKYLSGKYYDKKVLRLMEKI